MQNPLISIIIPVYNSGQFLEKCLDSVCHQTFKNIEIICINDGSTDDSFDILRKYASNDERIRIISQTNSGVSHSRNIGANISQGEWISFIDSDDYISEELYSEFYSVLNQNDNFDIYMYNGVILCENDNPDNDELKKFFYNSNWIHKENNLYTFIDCKNPFYGNLSVSNKIFKKSFLIKNNITFKEKTIFEDQLYTINSMIKANRIYIKNKVGYYYIQHKNSTMHNIKKNVFNIFNIMKDVRTLLVENDLYEYEKYVFLQHKFNVYNYLFLLADNSVKEEFYYTARNDLDIEAKNNYRIDIIKQIQRSQLFFDFMQLTPQEYLKKHGYK